MSWGSFVKCVFPLRLHGSFLYLFKAQIGECSVIYCLFHADTQTLTRQFYTLHHWFTFLIVRVCHGLPDRSFNCVINQILLIFLITFSNTLHTQKGEKKNRKTPLCLESFIPFVGITDSSAQLIVTWKGLREIAGHVTLTPKNLSVSGALLKAEAHVSFT